MTVKLALCTKKSDAPTPKVQEDWFLLVSLVSLQKLNKQQQLGFVLISNWKQLGLLYDICTKILGLLHLLNVANRFPGFYVGSRDTLQSSPTVELRKQMVFVSSSVAVPRVTMPITITQCVVVGLALGHSTRGTHRHSLPSQSTLPSVVLLSLPAMQQPFRSGQAEAGSISSPLGVSEAVTKNSRSWSDLGI